MYYKQIPLSLYLSLSLSSFKITCKYMFDNKLIEHMMKSKIKLSENVIIDIVNEF